MKRMEKVGGCVCGLILSPCTIKQWGDRLEQGSRKKVKDFREPKKKKEAWKCNCFAIRNLGLFFFSISVKNCIRILVGIVLSLEIDFGMMPSFTTLIQSTCEHGRSFYVSIFCNFFFQCLEVVIIKPSTSFLNLIPRFFWVFFKGFLSLISFSVFSPT